MADSTPLLPRSDPSEDSKKSPSLDETIEQYIGDFGLAQLVQAVLVSLAWFFDSQQAFISVFTDAEPTWHCTQFPGNHSSSCTSVSNICQLPANAWAWDRPVFSSFISEWGLQCASSLIKGLPASSFFAGCLAGGLLLASLADSYVGRKNTLLLSCLLMSFATFLTVFSTNVWIYSALKFLNGFGRASIGSCALVLSSELVGKRWRAQVGMINFLCFALGFLSLPAIGYPYRNYSWKVLYLWTSLSTISYCIFVYVFVRESPRWLFVHGRKEEAVSVLKSMGPAKSSNITMSFSDVEFERDSWNANIYSALKILIKRRWAFKRLSSVMIMGLGIGMGYYGLPLGLENLAFNLYLSVVLNALSELLASLLTFFIVGKLNRKSSLLALTILSASCNILCSVLRKVSTYLQIGLELVSFFSACTAVNILIIYTLEMFPTCVRNSAVSVVRQALVLGGVISPILVAAGGRGGFVSYGVFGVVIGICGLFVLSLPETRGCTLCDTLEEEEHKETCRRNDRVACV
ncbi:hypothetical protein K2173_004543 [Erythroxylum novogranatense]|uniref:Major facilitator superfamily (MFS) profile domain-containing protein n=1 Tax=Erythroxylum novogranatense TaxID=1862640 RepID=A0AAV8T5U5_9ROSI|nr:hypothetical protein K2173_004543 [Erythroxylum novogranatense]